MFSCFFWGGCGGWGCYQDVLSLLVVDGLRFASWGSRLLDWDKVIVTLRWAVRCARCIPSKLKHIPVYLSTA